MWKNYLLIAWRNLVRSPGYSLINIVGLTVGLAACFCMLAFAWHEASYERLYSDHNRIYMVGSGSTVRPGSPMPLATRNFEKDLALLLGDNLQATSLKESRNLHITLNNIDYKQDFCYASENFFEFFDMRFLEGDAGSALSAPMSVVLPKKLALKYFGTETALGKTLLIDGKHVAAVTGVVDFPTTTHLPEAGFLSYSSYHQIDPRMAKIDEAKGLTKFTYLKLGRDISPQIIQEMATPLLLPPGLPADHPQVELVPAKVIPITSIHLSMEHGSSDEGYGSSTLKVRNSTMLHGAVLLAVVILAIACLNFINLATATFSGRSKEIAIRQTSGATGRQLFIQYTVETVSLTLLSGLLAAAILPALIPLFGNTIGRDLSAIDPNHPLSLLGVLGFSVLVGLIIGLYPARVLASRKPAEGFRQQTGRRRQRLQKILIGTQFSIATTLIIVTLFASTQLNTLQNFDHGLNAERVIRLSISNASAHQQEQYISEVIDHPGVINAARPRSTFFAPRGNTMGAPEELSFRVSDGNATVFNFKQSFRITALEPRMIEMLDIPLLAGRNFVEQDLTTYSGRAVDIGGGVILTESGLKKLGIGNPQDAIGQTLYMDYTPSEQYRGFHLTEEERHPSHNKFSVIGVSKNFNLGSAYAPNYDDAIIYRNDGSTLLFKLAEKNFSATLNDLIQRARDLFPDSLIEPIHITNIYERQNWMLSRVVNTFTSGAMLAIILAALGLYALTAITIERRSKEIGVRKILGSSRTAVTRLILWSQSKPLLIALVLAIPCGYLFTSQVLQYFPHPVPLSPLTFALAAAISLGTAWLTMAAHTLRAANSDPAQELRDE